MADTSAKRASRAFHQFNDNTDSVGDIPVAYSGETDQTGYVRYGLNPNYWNECLFLAFKGFHENAIFLSGVPDALESLSQKHVAGENLC